LADLVGSEVVELREARQGVDGVEAADEDGGNGDDEAVYEVVAEKGGDDFGATFDHEAVYAKLTEVLEEGEEVDSAVFISLDTNDLCTVLFELVLFFLVGLVCGGDPWRLEFGGKREAKVTVEDDGLGRTAVDQAHR
jgi:hypothetical protein